MMQASSSLKTFRGIMKEFERSRKLKVQPGEIIIGQGEEPRGVFLVKRGFVKLYTISDDGEERIHIVYHAGEIFPLVWALKGTRVSSIIAEALTDAIIHCLPREKLLEHVGTDLETANLIISQLSEQFYLYARRLENLEIKNTQQRVASRLLFLSERFGRPSNGGILIDAPITHEIIANSINLRRETVSREIEKFKKLKIVDSENHHLVITNKDKLERLASY